MNAECYYTSHKGQRSSLGMKMGGKIRGDRMRKHRREAITQFGEYHAKGLGIVKHLQCFPFASALLVTVRKKAVCCL